MKMRASLVITHSILGLLDSTVANDDDKIAAVSMVKEALVRGTGLTIPLTEMASNVATSPCLRTSRTEPVEAD
jgi:hypothetical protein